MAKGGKGGRGYQRRSVDTREIRQRFFIFCEGQKTEPAYFESFRAQPIVVRVEGGNVDPLRMVDAAYDRLRRERADDPRPRLWDKQNQVWCVFDRDDVPADRFRSAMEKAKKHGIHVAYSNPAFELWFLLHFQVCGGGITRQQYVQRLSRWLERPYKKNDDRLHQALEMRLEEAIDRAARLLAGYNPHDPAEDDPATTVHLLVQELRRFSRL